MVLGVGCRPGTKPGDPKTTLPWWLPPQPWGLPCARVSGAHTCHHELCAVALVDLRPGWQVDGPAEVDAAVIALGRHDAHVKLLPIGQRRDAEAPVSAGLAAVLREGGQFVHLVAGALAVPVEDEALRLTGEAAGEGGIRSLGHDQPGGEKVRALQGLLEASVGRAGVRWAGTAPGPGPSPSLSPTNEEALPRASAPEPCSPPGQDAHPRGRTLTPGDRAIAPGNRTLAPRTDHFPPGTACSPQGQRARPRGQDACPKGEDARPRGRMLGPGDSVLAPADSVLAPGDRTLAPGDRTLAPGDGTLGPWTGRSAPGQDAHPRGQGARPRGQRARP